MGVVWTLRESGRTILEVLAAGPQAARSGECADRGAAPGEGAAGTGAGQGRFVMDVQAAAISLSPKSERLLMLAEQQASRLTGVRRNGLMAYDRSIV
jgi:hypothetical protein